ncbi:MAG: hypothetical protein ACI9FU_000676, partial [Granulosicoccus sp.]
MIKRLLFLTSFLVFSCSAIAQDYSGWWTEVDELINKGQPKSAQEKLSQIHDTAIKENNGPMLIKALIHEVKLKGQYEEESLQQSIGRLEEVASKMKASTANVIHSMLAEMYWGYYTQNRWQFHQRTNTTKESDDIATWDFKKIVAKADHHYRLSLKSSEKLNSESLKSYAAIIQGNDKYRDLRPTLYHLLLSRAMDFYASEEQDLVNFDKDGFYNSSTFLGASAAFLAVEIDTTEKLEPAKRTTFLFQELMLAASENIEAFVLEDLKRLEFFHRRSKNEGKDSLYQLALDQLLEKHIEHRVGSDIRYAIGQLLFNHGNNFNLKSGDDELQGKWKAAHEICTAGLTAFPNSIGAKNCNALISQIEQRNIGISARQVVLPQADFLVKLDYRNVGSNDKTNWPVYARLATLDPIVFRKEQRGNYGDKLIRWLKKVSTPILDIKFDIPNPGDFRQHGIELPFEGLPIGTYVVFMGTDDKFSTSKNAVGYAIVTVSNLATVQQSLPDGRTRLSIKSRDKGASIVGATVKLIEQRYDRSSRSQQFDIKSELITDENGEVFWKPKGGGRHENLVVDVIHNEDRLIGSGSLYARYRNQNDTWRESTQFFLDRAIYRPGQTVNFKGIMTSSDGMDNKVVANKNTVVRLFDTNGQEVSQLSLNTNNYGTFSGTFILPSAGLNGNFRLVNENGSRTFKMEEYKRPKFEVSLEKPEDQFRVGDTVSVSGSAMTYSGVPLTNADFKYRIVRNTTFPYRWLCWYWQPPTQQKQVAFGSGTTDANGQFNIDFEAQPDNAVNRWYKPVFSYNIEVDVVDISGEVQSTTSSVAVGYHALNLSFDLPETIERKDLGQYAVTATNLSGKEQAVNVTIKVWTVKHPDRQFRQRKWGEPDQFLLTKKEHQGRFFYDPYKAEHDFRNWKKDRNMLDQKLNTGGTIKANLKPLSMLDAGRYLVEITAKDAFGTEVRQQQYYTLYGEDDGKTPILTTNWLNVKKSTLEPGDDLELLFGSSYQDVEARLQIEVKDRGRNINKIIHDELIKVSSSTESLSIPVTEEWRGNAQLYISFVHNNEMYTENRTVSVPYTNRKLDVMLETFRKEMSPDDKEEWTISIKDKSSNAAKAELLTTMYDASLDVLATNNWSLNLDNYLQPQHAPASSNFGMANRNVWDRDWRIPWQSAVTRSFESLNWFGHRFGGSYSRNFGSVRGSRMESVMVSAMADGDMAMAEMDASEAPMAATGNVTREGADKLSDDTMMPKEPEITLRSDFSETVFFHPHLTSDESGLIKLNFTAPQSLTKWKFMALASSDDLKIGSMTEEVVTRKQLMISPNYPRFVREGDKLTFQVKVNVLDSTISEVTASLEVKNGL